MNATRTGRLVAALSLVLLLGGVAAFAVAIDAHYPIRHWLFWRYAAYWMVCAGWSFSCLSAGSWAIERAFRVMLPATESLLVGMATGVLIFFLGMFAAGACGLLHPAVAMAWPIAMALPGARRSLDRLRRLSRAVASSWTVAPRQLAIAGFGGLGVAMVYFAILTPDNVGFDARWYHLPIAEHFAAAGRIGPFAEGWYLGAYPHLASVVYTWAFLLPGTELFDRVLLSAHLEFTFFLATIGAVPLLVRRLAGGPRFRWEAFAAVFLFPCLLLYDGSLFVGADHVLAFWAIPVFSSILHLVRDPTPRRFALLSTLVSGALLTKYHAVYLLAPAVIAATFAFVRAKRARAPRPLRGPAVALGLGIALTAPHWAANWSWYGDPVYPLLHAHLDDGTWTPGALRRLDTFFASATWGLHGSFASKLAETAKALVTFSIEPHDWPTYHGAVPVFGSLFTILCVLLPFLPGTRRTAALVGSTLLGVGIWFATSHQDRYLQCLVPWMAAATSAIAYRAWSQLPHLRAPLLLTFGLSIVWGGDVYFMHARDDSYEIDRPSPVHAAVDLLSSGHRGEYEARLHPYAPWEAIGRALPPTAKVLLHERYLHLGLGRMSVTDLPGWQGRISYEDLVTSKAIAERLRRFEVTHVLWETETSHESDSFAGDLAFFRFVAECAEHPRSFGPFTLASVEPSRASSQPGFVAWYDCPNGSGELRPLADLDADDQATPIPPLDPESELPKKADLAVVNRDCHAGFRSTGWTFAANRGRHALWVRAPIRGTLADSAPDTGSSI